MQKIIGLLSLGILVIIGAFLWHKNTLEKTVQNGTKGSEKITVVATFYPLEELARSVGGERTTVKSIVPAGAEPHEYEPSAQDVLEVYAADVFLLNGAGVDAWAEKIRPELEKRGVRVRQMSEVVSLLPRTGGAEAEDNVSPYDPHFWLDPVNAEEEVKAVSSALIERDPSGRDEYLERTAETLEKLSALDNDYRSGLKECRQNTIIASHNAFSYLAKRYGFASLSISGISPEAEPSSRKMAELTQVIRDKKIKYVFFETLVSPKVSETLARETGASVLIFNPIEGLTDEERGKGENYFSIMKENLTNLKTALECQ